MRISQNDKLFIQKVCIARLNAVFKIFTNISSNRGH